jgi:hypothetical protein
LKPAQAGLVEVIVKNNWKFYFYPKSLQNIGEIVKDW